MKEFLAARRILNKQVSGKRVLSKWMTTFITCITAMMLLLPALSFSGCAGRYFPYGIKPQDTANAPSTSPVSTSPAQGTGQQPPSVPDSEGKVLPVDEGSQDPSFKKFRDDLLKAVQKRDKDFILGIIDPNIKVSFGGQSGKEDFVKYWNLNSGESKLWQELKDILELGGTFEGQDKTTFWAPYVYTRFPTKYDVNTHACITGKDVRLRAGPSLKAEVLRYLSYDVVKAQSKPEGDTVTIDGFQYQWLKVETLSGRQGYVAAKYVRSPIGYRACFKKQGDRWMMTVLVTGD